MKKKIVETTGRIDDGIPTQLDMIIGNYNELARYGTKSEEEYKSQLEQLDQADLETHARSLGLVPIFGVERLRNSLISEFRNYNYSLYKPSPPKSAKLTEAARKILAEGR